jgi:hypothetical protein
MGSYASSCAAQRTIRKVHLYTDDKVPALQHVENTHRFVTPGLPTLSRALVIDLAVAVGLAFLWWSCAMLLQPTYAVNVLTDQNDIFMPAGRAMDNPYRVPGFFNPPWAAVMLAPFGILPLPLAALLQLALYFVLISLVIRKFGGDRRALLITLTSFVAFNSATELNVEWMICIGLLVPQRYSLPFLVIKPQTALGYVFSFRWRDLVRATVLGLLFGVFALLLWGHLLPQMIVQAGQASAMSRPFNAAPMALIGIPAAVLCGIGLGVIGVYRRDPILCIFAWVFLMPYVALYGLLLHLALLAVRAPRLALVISLVLWVIFGGMLGSYLWSVLMP